MLRALQHFQKLRALSIKEPMLLNPLLIARANFQLFVSGIPQFPWRFSINPAEAIGLSLVHELPRLKVVDLHYEGGMVNTLVAKRSESGEVEGT